MTYEFRVRKLDDKYKRKVKFLKNRLGCKDKRDLLIKLIDEKEKEIFKEFSETQPTTRSPTTYAG